MSAALASHLTAWFGAWPTAGDGVQVVASAHRDGPGWDGAVRPLAGALRPDGSGAVVVAPRLHEELADLLDGVGGDRLVDDEQLRRAVGHVVHGEGAALGAGVLRWVAAGEDTIAADVASLGVWLDHTDPRVPDWLHPFGGRALLALDDTGSYAAGVGVKRHDETGHELAVVTDEQHRGHGLARRLVATAARHELARVDVVTYLHARDNRGSAHVADAVGFRDRGWLVVGVFGGAAPG